MVDVPEYFCRYLNSQHNLRFLHLFKLGSIEIDLLTHKSKFCCLHGQKTSLNQLKPSLDMDIQRLKKTTVSVFFGPGLVFFSFRKCQDWSHSQSYSFGPKNQTGLSSTILMAKKSNWTCD